MLPVTLKPNVDRYYLQGIEGFFKAEVYVSRLSDGTQVVCKDYSRFRTNPIAAFVARHLVQREYNVLAQLQDWLYSPKVFNSEDSLVLLQEYVPGKTISEFKKLEPGVVHTVRKVLRQLHQKGIIHNDVRASNVIVKADNTVVLIDFTSAGSLPSFMGKISRWLMHHDLRHAIKFKLKTEENLTAREQRILQKPKLLEWQQNVWKQKILPFLKGG